MLSTIHDSYEFIPVRPSIILQLHRDLYKFSGKSIGGAYKNADNVIAEEDNDKLLNKYDGTNNTKTLAAKEFMDRVSSGNLVLTEVTRDNFRKLFVALGIIQQ